MKHTGGISLESAHKVFHLTEDASCWILIIKCLIKHMNILGETQVLRNTFWMIKSSYDSGLSHNIQKLDN